MGILSTENADVKYLSGRSVMDGREYIKKSTLSVKLNTICENSVDSTLNVGHIKTRLTAISNTCITIRRCVCVRAYARAR